MIIQMKRCSYNNMYFAKLLSTNYEYKVPEYLFLQIETEMSYKKY